MSTDTPRGSDMVRVHLRMAAIDLLLTGGSFMVWLYTGGVDMRALAGGMVVRVLAMHLLLWQLLGPARAWQALGAGADDRSLLAADAALQRMPRRFVIGYVLGWCALQLLVLAVTVLDPRPGLVVADAELITFGLISLAAIAVTAALMVAGASSMAQELSAEVSRELFERKLRSPRPRVSFNRELLIFFSAFSFAVVLGIISAGGKARVDAIRETTLAEQKIRVALAAADIRTGLEPRPGVVVVGELPPVLRDQPTTVEGLVGAFDPAHERVVAAAAVDGSWVIAEAHPQEQLLGLALFSLLFSSLVAPLGALGATALGRTLNRPLDELREAARRMAERGELRALGRVVPQRNDELGSLVASFNDMLDMLEELSAAATTVAEGDLRVTLDHPGEVHEAFRAMVSQLRLMVTRLRTTALDVASASAEIQASTQAHEAAATRQSEIVRDASTTVASLTADADNISEMAEDVLGDAELGLTTVDAVVAKIDELNHLTRGIAELLEVIRDIANRSDLLALNGSLEATRVGEAGRGFALVASEMRRLAERVANTVANVGARVADIEAASAGTVAATEQSRELARRTAEAARRISSVTRKQSEATEQASAATLAMAEFVVAAAAGTSQTRAAAEGLHEQVVELERLTRRFEIDDELTPGA